jgi:hypothetical protein
MYQSPYGKPDKDLGKRLAYWANQLSHDRRYPWVGLGLIADLNCAAKQLGSDPEKMFPKTPVAEFDL